VAATLLAAMLLWLAVWKPLAGHYRFLQQDLQIAREASQQMQQQRGKVLQTRASSPAAVSNENLYSAVTKLLKQQQLDGEGSSLNDEEGDKVRIKLTGKPFDGLVRFLDQVERDYAAHAVSMTLKPAKDSGLIDAEILLQR
jgi:type II secretory pathway component PulM